MIAEILAIVASLGIVIACIIGFVFSEQFVEALNQTSCSFFLFYQDGKFGQETTALPRWAGPTKIKETLDGTSKAIDSIVANSKTAFSDNSWVDSDSAAFNKLLTDANSKFSGSTLTNPNPANSLKGGVSSIKPIYIDTYGDYSKSGAKLNTIYQEYDIKIKASVTSLDQAKSYSSLIESQSSTLKSTFDTAATSIDDFNKLFDDLDTGAIKTWKDGQDQINDTGVTIFLIFFVVSMVLALLSVIFLILLMISAKCCSCTRMILHIIWNITALIMIVNFIVGSVFGILGLFATDAPDVFNYAFSTENLKGSDPIIFTDAGSDSNNYLNVCMNGDGDLEKEIISDSSSTDDIEQLYDVSNKLSTTMKEIKANSNSIAVETIDKEYNNLKNDITKTTSPTLGENHIGTMDEKLRGWSDWAQTSGQAGCSPKAYDVFVQTKEVCPSGYTFNNSGKLGDKNCIVFLDTTGSSQSSRYGEQSGCSSSTSDFSGPAQAVTAYVNGFSSYAKANSDLLDSMIQENVKINDAFKSAAGKILASLENVDGVISPLNDLFSDLVGDKGMFALVNCSKWKYIYMGYMLFMGYILICLYFKLISLTFRIHRN